MSVFAKPDGPATPAVMMARVIKAVEKLSQVPDGVLRGPCRSREYVAPRHIAMLACREIAGASLPQIARAFGGRHHTSVMYAVGAAKNRADWREDLDEIRRALEAVR